MVGGCGLLLVEEEEERGEEERGKTGLDWVIVGWSGPGSQVNSPSSSEAHLG